MIFPILFDDRTIGEAQVQKSVLYYKFFCKCIPPDSKAYRVILIYGETEINLGICVPNNEYFILNKQVPVKYIEEGEWSFMLRSVANANDIQVAVHENEPFPLLDQLELAKLVNTDGKIFVYIKGLQ